MQSEQFDQDNNSNGEEDVMLNDVDKFLLQLDSTVYEIGIRDAQSNQTLLKTVANGTYNRKEVVMVQFSGTSSSKIKQKVFRNHLRYYVTSTHANIARFIGGTNPSSLDRFPFVLIRQSPGLDHEEFLRLNGSTKALMRFLEGVQQGTRFIYEHGIKQRDCIKVLPSGDAVVYPSGVLRSKFSGRNSTKRAVRHLLRDVDLSDPVLPLQAIYELLSAAENESQTKAIEQSLLDVNPVTEHTIWRIADVLELPITRELHYHGPLPKFTLAVGDAGHVKPPLSVDVLARANSKISIESWNKAISTTSNEDEGFRKNQAKWREPLSSRAMKIQAATPYFLDYDFPLSSISIEGWLRYDDVLKKAEGKCVDMCLLYATERRVNSLDTPKVEHVITHGDEPIFTVRSICTRLRFEIPASNSVPKPVYFHRRPNVDASPREYWGFISDMNDPLAPPSRQIQELTLRYEIQIRTIMRGDSWGGRADARLEDELKRLPGTFFS